jgi:hypothetical protein
VCSYMQVNSRPQGLQRCASITLSKEKSASVKPQRRSLPLALTPCDLIYSLACGQDGFALWFFSRC